MNALNLNWLGLASYVYPLTALLHKVVQNIKQYSWVVILIALDWPEMPRFFELVQLSLEFSLQYSVAIHNTKASMLGIQVCKLQK